MYYISNISITIYIVILQCNQINLQYKRVNNRLCETTDSYLWFLIPYTAFNDIE